MSTQKQPQVVFPSRQHNALVRRGGCEDDLIRVEIFLRELSQAIRKRDSRRQRQNYKSALPPHQPHLGQLPAENPGCPSSHQSIEQTEEKTGTHQAEPRGQQYWKQ